MKTKLAVVYRQIDALIPFASNSRTHSDEQVAQIAASIREFGFTNPILTDGDNGIIAGHGRLMAARKLAMDEVPTIELAGLTAAQKRAYVIADNKLALNAGWDMATLANEFHALNEAGFDLGLTGFGADELTSIMFEPNFEKAAPESSTKEINPDEYSMQCRCPKCGFEFDPD
jgi:ParB family transcriptional regulator, chromosome partitioning protein